MAVRIPNGRDNSRLASLALLITKHGRQSAAKFVVDSIIDRRELDVLIVVSFEPLS